LWHSGEREREVVDSESMIIARVVRIAPTNPECAPRCNVEPRCNQGWRENGSIHRRITIQRGTECCRSMRRRDEIQCAERVPGTRGDDRRVRAPFEKRGLRRAAGVPAIAPLFTGITYRDRINRG